MPPRVLHTEPAAPHTVYPPATLPPPPLSPYNLKEKIEQVLPHLNRYMTACVSYNLGIRLNSELSVAALSKSLNSLLSLTCSAVGLRAAWVSVSQSTSSVCKRRNISFCAIYTAEEIYRCKPLNGKITTLSQQQLMLV